MSSAERVYPSLEVSAPGTRGNNGVQNSPWPPSSTSCTVRPLAYSIFKARRAGDGVGTVCPAQTVATASAAEHQTTLSQARRIMRVPLLRTLCAGRAESAVGFARGDDDARSGMVDCERLPVD